MKPAYINIEKISEPEKLSFSKELKQKKQIIPPQAEKGPGFLRRVLNKFKGEKKQVLEEDQKILEQNPDNPEIAAVVMETEAEVGALEAKAEAQVENIVVDKNSAELEPADDEKAEQPTIKLEKKTLRQKAQELKQTGAELNQKRKEWWQAADKKELKLVALEQGYKTTASIVGVKFATDVCLALIGKGDIAKFMKGSREMKDIKKEMESIKSESEVTEKLASIKEKLEKSKTLSVEKKAEFLARAKEIMEKKIKAGGQNEKELKKDISNTLNDFIQKKATGISIGKDLTNLALTASGYRIARSLAYGGLAMADRANKAGKKYNQKFGRSSESGATEAGDEGAKKESKLMYMLKDVFVTSTKETIKGLMFSKTNVEGKELSATERGVEFAKSFGVVMRIIGIGGSGARALTEGIMPQDFLSLTNALNEHNWDKALQYAAHNIASNAEHSVVGKGIAKVGHAVGIGETTEIMPAGASAQIIREHYTKDLGKNPYFNPKSMTNMSAENIPQAETIPNAINAAKIVENTYTKDLGNNPYADAKILAGMSTENQVTVESTPSELNPGQIAQEHYTQDLDKNPYLDPKLMASIPAENIPQAETEPSINVAKMVEGTYTKDLGNNPYLGKMLPNVKNPAILESLRLGGITESKMEIASSNFSEEIKLAMLQEPHGVDNFKIIKTLQHLNLTPEENKLILDNMENPDRLNRITEYIDTVKTENISNPEIMETLLSGEVTQAKVEIATSHFSDAMKLALLNDPKGAENFNIIKTLQNLPLTPEEEKSLFDNANNPAGLAAARDYIDMHTPEAPVEAAEVEKGWGAEKTIVKGFADVSVKEAHKIALQEGWIKGGKSIVLQPGDEIVRTKGPDGQYHYSIHRDGEEVQHKTFKGVAKHGGKIPEKAKFLSGDRPAVKGPHLTYEKIEEIEDKVNAEKITPKDVIMEKANLSGPRGDKFAGVVEAVNSQTGVRQDAMIGSGKHTYLNIPSMPSETDAVASQRGEAVANSSQHTTEQTNSSRATSSETPEIKSSGFKATINEVIKEAHLNGGKNSMDTLRQIISNNKTVANYLSEHQDEASRHKVAEYLKFINKKMEASLNYQADLLEAKAQGMEKAMIGNTLRNALIENKFNPNKNYAKLIKAI